ncbi:MAG: IS1595 family transposase [Bosea sp. (in: a-proteobacteria)]|uniref:IS1595 family transposase n=1 Tax=Bosea sp. (in: a-proteobacteria) TaxID=1871050 RepID=UPI00273778CE|nr:IS1595 family transposase [Bosea sp. (in: a-proteobacteria)]MDP3257324.1 IS1595 family transposase [Bosea sp. (in: a-proteobacteria)]MDP3321494.1 IS1595 family transposase [Bosea sp. (in: a-proteobacteria)]
MAAALDSPIFTDADKAREHLEAQRWPNGVVCAQCGNADPEKIHSLKGKAHRPGVYQCAECRGQFTVTVGTVFERSKIPLNKWLLAVHLMTSSKKGISTHQIHRMLNVTYKTAWFMCHRIREAMRDDNPPPMGGDGHIVEADETYFGDKEVVAQRTKRGKTRIGGKRAVVALVERGGSVRSFHVKSADATTIREIVVTNVHRTSVLHTDESKLYTKTGAEFDGHETVRHTAGEYVRGIVHTNTIEGFFSVFKRGMKGIYQHCAEKHLFRYLAEFDFRYNNRTKLGVSDVMRRDNALKGIEGKRLTYRRVGSAALA